jgi:hypothetical protein
MRSVISQKRGASFPSLRGRPSRLIELATKVLVDQPVLAR